MNTPQKKQGKEDKMQYQGTLLEFFNSMFKVTDHHVPN